MELTLRCHWFVLVAPILVTLLSEGVISAQLEECQPKNVTYGIADSEQCDKFYDCQEDGKINERMCDDGFVFSLAIRKCEYPYNVDCTKRPKLQPPQSTDKNCERKNGLYPFPSEISCQKFYHCLEDKAYEKTCPEGVIFDRSVGACVHPDMSKRTDCAAHTVLNFQCPNMEERFALLKFGDHERLAHPDDCRKFYICFMDGQPRLGGCPVGKVFNSNTGFCAKPELATDNCKDYYTTGLGKSANFEQEAEEDLTKKKNVTAAEDKKAE